VDWAFIDGKTALRLKKFLQESPGASLAELLNEWMDREERDLR
jgi:hypothetical protein